MPVYEITSCRGGISDYEDKGTDGTFKMGRNLDIRQRVDAICAGQALVEEGLLDYSRSPSASISPSSSVSPSSSASPTPSPSSSASPSSSPSSSQSASTGISPSPSSSPSASASPSASQSPSSSVSTSPSASGGLDSVFDDLILFWVKCRDGFTYGFGNTGSIYRRDTDGVHVRVYKDENGAIKGAAEKPQDDGNIYLIWATDKHVKRKLIPGLSNWNDVEIIAGNLTSADHHTIRVIGGAAMIANGSMLALVGYDGSYTNEAVDFIPGNIVKTIVERAGRSVVGTYREGYPKKGVNAAIDAEFPMAQIGDDGEIFFANMTDNMPFKRFPGGGVVNPGGVANLIDHSQFFDWEETALSWIDKQEVGNLSLWAVYGAETGYNGIYSLGRKNKNAPYALNLDYAIEADELGALTVVDGIVLVSYRNGYDFGVLATDPNNKAEAEYEGLDFKAPVKKPLSPTNWRQVELFMAPLPDHSWVEVQYRLNKEGDFIKAKCSDANGHQKSERFTTAGEQEAIFTVVGNGEIYEPKLVVHPYGNETPKIYKVKTRFV